MNPQYRTDEDVAVCRALHRKHGTTYYFSTLRFPADIKWQVHGLYGFVRIADEWVDNPGGLTIQEQRSKLEAWRDSMVRGIAGEKPEHPAMRVFCDAIRERNLPVQEAHCFLNAMIMDLDKARYETYEELREYVRGSASAIGILMCSIIGAPSDSDTIAQAQSLGEAMQLTNFLRDVAEDYRRGRIYLPQEDMARFGVSNQDIACGKLTSNVKQLIQFEIERARGLYAYSDAGIQKLPKHAQKAILLARLLYSQILDQIEANEYQIFDRRVRTNLAQKLLCAAKVGVASHRILEHLNQSGRAI